MNGKCPVCEKLKEWLDEMIKLYPKDVSNRYVSGANYGFYRTKIRMAKLEKECEDSKEAKSKTER